MDPFGPGLDVLVRARKNQSEIITTRIWNVRHARECNVLSVAKSKEQSLTSIFDHLADQPVLTIADINGFSSRGGIISLKLVQESVRFEINVCVAEQIGLRFRSELLLLTDVISGKIKRERFNVFTE